MYVCMYVCMHVCMYACMWGTDHDECHGGVVRAFQLGDCHGRHCQSLLWGGGGDGCVHDASWGGREDRVGGGVRGVFLSVLCRLISCSHAPHEGSLPPLPPPRRRESVGVDVVLNPCRQPPVSGARACNNCEWRMRIPYTYDMIAPSVSAQPMTRIFLCSWVCSYVCGFLVNTCICVHRWVPIYIIYIYIIYVCMYNVCVCVYVYVYVFVICSGAGAARMETRGPVAPPAHPRGRATTQARREQPTQVHETMMTAHRARASTPCVALHTQSHTWCGCKCHT